MPHVLQEKDHGHKRKRQNEDGDVHPGDRGHDWVETRPVCTAGEEYFLSLICLKIPQHGKDLANDPNDVDARFNGMGRTG